MKCNFDTQPTILGEKMHVTYDMCKAQIPMERKGQTPKTNQLSLSEDRKSRMLDELNLQWCATRRGVGA